MPATHPRVTHLELPPEFPTVLALLDTYYRQRFTGAVPLVLHFKDGVPTLVDVATYTRVSLTATPT